MHQYRVNCRWTGSTGVGYEAYDRTHSAAATPASLNPASLNPASLNPAPLNPAAATLTLSADPSFRGDPAFLNPEQLFVLAAASCQLLSFLAVTARARIDVVAYEDDADGEMPDDERYPRVTRILLRPRIAVSGDVTEARVRHLCEVAHRECYIANSVTTDITVEPTITITRRAADLPDGSE